MKTKWQSISYAVQKRFNKWFSRIIFPGFSRKQIHNPKNIKQLFVTKQIIVPKNSKYYDFGYNDYEALIKYI